MSENQRIVVGYDASPAADLALDWAARTARAQGAELCVRVVVSAMDPVVHSTRALADLYANRRLAHAVSLLDDLGVQNASLEVLHGAVFPALVEDAGRDGTLVLGSDGHRPLGGLVHGSVSQDAARFAHGPLVVVRACEDPEARRIVVGVDGSPASLAALRWAAARAAVSGEEVLAVTVIDVGRRRRGADAPLTERGQQRYDLAVLRLRRELGILRRAHPQVRLEQETRAADVTDLLVARSRRASLLVLGARNREPLVALALGSTTQELLAESCCPVALVRGVPVTEPASTGSGG